WMPAVTATRGPGREPWTSATGTSSVVVPRSTRTIPVTRCPGAALTGPIAIEVVVMVARVAAAMGHGARWIAALGRRSVEDRQQRQVVGGSQEWAREPVGLDG